MLLLWTIMAVGSIRYGPEVEPPPLPVWDLPAAKSKVRGKGIDDLNIVNLEYHSWTASELAAMTNCDTPGAALTNWVTAPTNSNIGRFISATWCSLATAGQISIWFSAPSNGVYGVQWKPIKLDGPYFTNGTYSGAWWLWIGFITNDAGPAMLHFKSGMVEDLGFFRIKL